MTPWTVNSRRCNVCTIEKTLSKDDLFLCSGCRLIRYCSRDHQRLDWEIHRVFCSAVRHIVKSREIAHIMDLEGPITAWNQFEKALILAKCLLHTILKRELANHEVELLTFPVHCQVCFTRGDRKTFSNCTNCKAVSYCNQDHQKEDSENHSRWCLYLKFYYSFYELETFNVELNFQGAPAIDEANMPADLFSLIETTHKPCKDYKLTDKPKNLTEYQYYATVCNYSCVATLLYCINLCHLTKDPCNDTMVIYLIGSRDEHLFLQKSHCTFLSSQLPNIKTFHFYLIGPEVHASLENVTYKLNTGREEETIVNIHFEKETFEKFAENILSNSKLEMMPHFIAAFNCGFYENAGTPRDTWREGIKVLFKFNRVPILFTSYTKLECRFDLREFSVCANTLASRYEIVVNGVANAYKDYRPFRNMELHDRKDLVYFRNGYMHLVIVGGEK